MLIQVSKCQQKWYHDQLMDVAKGDKSVKNPAKHAIGIKHVKRNLVSIRVFNLVSIDIINYVVDANLFKI